MTQELKDLWEKRDFEGLCRALMRQGYGLSSPVQMEVRRNYEKLRKRFRKNGHVPGLKETKEMNYFCHGYMAAMGGTNPERSLNSRGTKR